MSSFFYKRIKEGRDIITTANFKVFRAEIRKQLDLRGWRYKNLSAATGYSTRTIEAFMCGLRVTDDVADAIANALDIPKHMAT